MTTYEGSRQFLQKESSDGVSLYNHLANVLLKVCLVPSNRCTALPVCTPTSLKNVWVVWCWSQRGGCVEPECVVLTDGDLVVSRLTDRAGKS